MPAGEPEFAAALAPLLEPALDQFAVRLGQVGGLGAAERTAVREGARATLYRTVHNKVSRVLLVELNAARITGRLTAADSAARWEEFLAGAAQPQFWDALAVPYPALPHRLRTVIDNCCGALLTTARRLAEDRGKLAPLLGADPGELTAVSTGAGDSHRGGHSVAVLEFAVGRVVYKPRPLLVDAALESFLETVFAHVPPEARIRVPQVVQGRAHGWAQHVEHTYCRDATQVATFYRGLGHWLALTLLLGASDLHGENVIACGPVPVVVDCETLFTPVPQPPPSGFGLAVDRAGALLARSVLRTGLLPSRGTALGLRGVDSSAAGFLPGQQPLHKLPAIVDAGLDTARLGTVEVERLGVSSHPLPHPDPARSWDDVLDGFSQAMAALRLVDRDGRLEGLVRLFAHAPIRIVPRATETYAELSRMLWHPASLHDQAAAVERAAAVLSGMAVRFPLAPSDPAVIAAEVADLLVGDIPYFATTPTHGTLTGPGGTSWLPRRDLLADALDRWRDTDEDLERRILRDSLICAVLNDGWSSTVSNAGAGDRDREPGHVDARQLDAPQLDARQLDARRRATAADVLKALAQDAIPGEDGTVAWIAPVPRDSTGWAVQPLDLDLYAGQAGLALLLAGYRHETAAGRADAVDAVPELLDAALRSLRVGEDEAERAAKRDRAPRPAPPGGFAGLGSRLWAWLALHRIAPDAVPDALDRARALARTLPEAVAATENGELLAGIAGAVVPLLHLAAETGEQVWLDQARDAGDRLVATAHRQNGAAFWPTDRWPRGLGGMAHGTTGTGWALARLALATGDHRHADTARAAFAFEDQLYDPRAGGWRDLRQTRASVVAAWCNGAVGIGLAAADLAGRGWEDDTDVLTRARARAATRRHGLGWNHTLCHGDLGSWELLAPPPAGDHESSGNPAASRHGPAELIGSPTPAAHILDSIERHGPTTGHPGGAPDPGLLAGSAGIAYQLLRMHPDCTLPSVLTLAL
jgi:type 2 lantibiotic biosynthesis protein LanM